MMLLNFWELIVLIIIIIIIIMNVLESFVGAEADPVQLQSSCGPAGGSLLPVSVEVLVVEVWS